MVWFGFTAIWLKSGKLISECFVCTKNGLKQHTGDFVFNFLFCLFLNTLFVLCLWNCNQNLDTSITCVERPAIYIRELVSAGFLLRGKSWYNYSFTPSIASVNLTRLGSLRSFQPIRTNNNFERFSIPDFIHYIFVLS